MNERNSTLVRRECDDNDKSVMITQEKLRESTGRDVEEETRNQEEEGESGTFLDKSEVESIGKPERRSIKEKLFGQCCWLEGEWNWNCVSLSSCLGPERGGRSYKPEKVRFFKLRAQADVHKILISLSGATSKDATNSPEG